MKQQQEKAMNFQSTLAAIRHPKLACRYRSSTKDLAVKVELSEEADRWAASHPGDSGAQKKAEEANIAYNQAKSRSIAAFADLLAGKLGSNVIKSEVIKI